MKEYKFPLLFNGATFHWIAMCGLLFYIFVDTPKPYYALYFGCFTLVSALSYLIHVGCFNYIYLAERKIIVRNILSGGLLSKEIDLEKVFQIKLTRTRWNTYFIIDMNNMETRSVNISFQSKNNIEEMKQFFISKDLFRDKK